MNQYTIDQVLYQTRFYATDSQRLAQFNQVTSPVCYRYKKSNPQSKSTNEQILYRIAAIVAALTLYTTMTVFF